MSDEPVALPKLPNSPAEGDYDAICAAMMHSARGRWFLEEYARRKRDTDTRRVLDAIERLEAAIRGTASESARVAFRADLLEMTRAIAPTRAAVAEINPAIGPDSSEVKKASAPAANSAVAPAARMQNIVAIMRERGIDPDTRVQIEMLASSLMSMPSLQDPTGSRAEKLDEVLHYLEQRIHSMIEASAPRAAATQSVENSESTQDQVAPAQDRDVQGDSVQDFGAQVLAASNVSDHAASTNIEALHDDPDRFKRALLDEAEAGRDWTAAEAEPEVERPAEAITETAAPAREEKAEPSPPPPETKVEIVALDVEPLEVAAHDWGPPVMEPLVVQPLVVQPIKPQVSVAGQRAPDRPPLMAEPSLEPPATVAFGLAFNASEVSTGEAIDGGQRSLPGTYGPPASESSSEHALHPNGAEEFAPLKQVPIETNKAAEEAVDTLETEEPVGTFEIDAIAVSLLHDESAIGVNVEPCTSAGNTPTMESPSPDPAMSEMAPAGQQGAPGSGVATTPAASVDLQMQADLDVLDLTDPTAHPAENAAVAVEAPHENDVPAIVSEDVPANASEIVPIEVAGTSTEAESSYYDPVPSMWKAPIPENEREAPEKERPAPDSEPADFLLDPLSRPDFVSRETSDISVEVSRADAAGTEGGDGADGDKDDDLAPAAATGNAIVAEIATFQPEAIDGTAKAAARPVTLATMKPAMAQPRAETIPPLPNDPLAGLMAMTDEERIALFT